MVKPTGERLAHLESESAQLRKELDALARLEKKLDRLCQNVESLMRSRNRCRQLLFRGLRWAAWLSATIGAEMVLGAWGRVLRALAQRFA
jgi:transposase